MGLVLLEVGPDVSWRIGRPPQFTGRRVGCLVLADQCRIDGGWVPPGLGFVRGGRRRLSSLAQGLDVLVTVAGERLDFLQPLFAGIEIGQFFS
jgi:hypothetical protein